MGIGYMCDFLKYGLTITSGGELYRFSLSAGDFIISNALSIVREQK